MVISFEMLKTCLDIIHSLFSSQPACLMLWSHRYLGICESCLGTVHDVSLGPLYMLQGSSSQELVPMYPGSLSIGWNGVEYCHHQRP